MMKMKPFARLINPIAKLAYITIKIKRHKEAASEYDEHLKEEIAIREAQAYMLGRSEIVDTMLHHIGNAINSVNIGIGTIQEKLINNRLMRHFAALANAVKDHQHDFSHYIENDPQGQKVAPLIIALAEDLRKHHEELARTADRVSERAKHIADIIQTEQASSNGAMVRCRRNFD